MQKNKIPNPIQFEGGWSLRIIRGPKKDQPNVWYFKIARREAGKDTAHLCWWDTLDQAISKAQKYINNPTKDIPAIQLMLDKWFTSASFLNLSPFSRRQYRTVGNRYLVRFFPDKYPDYQGVSEMIESLKTEGKSSHTISGVLIGGSALHKWGKVHGLVKGDSPFRSHPLEIKFAKVKYTPSEDQVKSVIDQMTGWKKLVIQIISETGLRIGEVNRMTWESINFQTGTILVAGKANRPRFIKMSPNLRTILEPIRSESGSILPITVVGSHEFYDGIRDACIAAQVPYFPPHSFRRYVVNRFRKAGVMSQVTAKWVGNSPKTMAKYYETIDEEELADAAAQVFAKQ